MLKIELVPAKGKRCEAAIKAEMRMFAQQSCVYVNTIIIDSKTENEKD